MTRQLFALVQIFLMLNTATAALIVDVQDASITAGGTGTIDVLISSTGTDSVDVANYLFEITNVGAPGSTLEFADPQTLTENLDANYLFASDLDPDGLEIFDLTTATLEGGDFTDSGNGVAVDATPLLLARLDLLHVLGAGQTAEQAAGEQFRIVLLDDSATFFEDENFNSLSIDASSFDIGGVGGGTITVAASAAVPEPSSLVLMSLLGIGAISAGCVRRRIRRCP